VLANRLNADDRHRVLPLEAGRAIHPSPARDPHPNRLAKLIDNPAATVYSANSEGSDEHDLVAARELLG